MAGGWSKDGGVQEQIDASVDDAVRRARAALPSGASRTECVECGAEIPEARQRAIAGVTHCVACQEELDNSAHAPAINRRASKDSLLR